MTSTNILILITNTLSTWGLAVLATIGYVIGIGVAYLIFTKGWEFTKRSLEGGAYQDFRGKRHFTKKGMWKADGVD